MSKPLDPLATIHSFLAVCRTASLATVDQAGAPHAANVQFFALPDLSIYFVSSALSAHSVHVAFNPRVALTVYAHNDAPESIHGLQLHGTCRGVEADERARLNPIYAHKFPIVSDGPGMIQRFNAMTMYRVTPEWVRWIDNRVHFGYKLEFRPGHPADLKRS